MSRNSQYTHVSSFSHLSGQYCSVYYFNLEIIVHPTSLNISSHTRFLSYSKVFEVQKLLLEEPLSQPWHTTVMTWLHKKATSGCLMQKILTQAFQGLYKFFFPIPKKFIWKKIYSYCQKKEKKNIKTIKNKNK